MDIEEMRLRLIREKTVNMQLVMLITKILNKFKAKKRLTDIDREFIKNMLFELQHFGEGVKCQKANGSEGST